MTKKRRNLKRRIEDITMPITRKRMKWGRNWLCLCNSGKKYKKCCMSEINGLTVLDDNANVEILPEDVKKIVDAHRRKNNE